MFTKTSLAVFLFLQSVAYNSLYCMENEELPPSGESVYIAQGVGYVQDILDELKTEYGKINSMLERLKNIEKEISSLHAQISDTFKVPNADSDNQRKHIQDAINNGLRLKNEQIEEVAFVSRMIDRLQSMLVENKKIIDKQVSNRQDAYKERTDLNATEAKIYEKTSKMRGFKNLYRAKPPAKVAQAAEPHDQAEPPAKPVQPERSEGSMRLPNSFGHY